MPPAVHMGDTRLLPACFAEGQPKSADREDFSQHQEIPAHGRQSHMQRYEGSCHCGAVRFAIVTDFPELTTCDCSLCRRKNALMVKVHEDRFTLLAGADSLTEYRFHTQ